MPTPAQRSTAASIAAHTRWSRTADRTSATQPGRDGLLAKFERQVDPDGALPVEVRAAMAENARRAHYRRMASRSAQVRRARTG